ncbi:MAG TPA: aromatic amino acid lyase, partial [Fimbriimonadaceae bacterium]|nr:aromatic amino acid lyase [Fimbriimonadaceae bacterium]
MATLDGGPLALAELERIGRGEAPVRLAAEARTRMTQSRRTIEAILGSGERVYGVNTGFGKLSDVRIAPADLARLQLNLVRSHACGVGEPLPDEAVRVMLALRANVLAKGLSGARPEVAERLLDFLRADLLPVVPSRGSVGASGDLAPLAHLALALIGEGRCRLRGEELPTGQALARAGLTPLLLEAKEGLALLNGTQA